MMKGKTEMSEIKIDDLKLEEALRRLDQVVKELDSENADLDKALKLYEEGVRLVRVCNAKLEVAERKIKVLRLSPDGEMTEEDFEAAEK